MEDFAKIDKRELSRLMVGNRKISISEVYGSFSDANVLRFIGCRRISSNKGFDYEIFDYSYYDVLNRNGITPNLANMISLHNFILCGGI